MIDVQTSPPIELGRPIGLTFGSELTMAGLVDVVLSWNNDGMVWGYESLTPEQRAIFDEVLAAHDPTRMVPLQTISRRQFFQASADKGMITQVEALNAVRHGEIPALMQQGLDTLSSDEKFAAEMLLSGAGEFDRNHPLVKKFGEIMGMPPTVLNDLWRYAEKL